MQNFKLNIIIYSLLIYFISCSPISENEVVFVSNAIKGDTLILNIENTYKRNLKGVTDTGSWTFSDGHIWLNNWINRGESYTPFGSKPSSVGFSVERNLTGDIQKIYFDVDDYYYFKRID